MPVHQPKVSPWGESPTPLVPVQLRMHRHLGMLQAPAAVCSLAGKPLVVRDLGAVFWNQFDIANQESLRSIVALVRSQIRLIRHMQIDLRVGKRNLVLDELPLGTRCYRALLRHIGRQPQLSTIDFWELLGIRNFGVRCLVEFACVVEAAQSLELSLRATAPSRQQPEHTYSPISSENRANVVQDAPPHRLQSALPPDISNFFRLLGAWAAGEQQLDRLGPVLPEASIDWPEELQLHWKGIRDADTRVLAGDAIRKFSVPLLLRRWIRDFDERIILILKNRVLVDERPETLAHIGERLGVTRERIRQIEKEAIKRLEQLRSPEYRPVMRRANFLRKKLGTVVPKGENSVDDVLTWVVADLEPDFPRSFAQQVFLWLAGPYKSRKGWLTADSRIVVKSEDALLRCESNHALIAREDARTALNELGIRETYHMAWIDHLKIFWRVEGGLLCVQGTILDKAEKLLRYLDRPATADEIVELIGSSSVRSVRQRLMDDPRFWRINKQSQFVLAGTVGYDEYTGIIDEITQELESCGGSATVEHLVEKIATTYGVKPTSVLAYLSTPLFVRNESNVVSLRQNEEVTIATDIRKTADCYRLKDGWAWRVRVDSQLMKGSGRLFPNAFARELGCELGQKIQVSSRFGAITISWPMGSTTGATIGSIRTALEGLDAAIGDYVFVVSHNGRIKFLLLRQHELETQNATARLARFVGVRFPEESENLLPAIAVALCVDKGSEPLERHIRDALLDRGENELCNYIELPKMTMDQHLDRIGSVLGGSETRDLNR